MARVTASAPTLAPLPARFARLVKIEHTVFALPFAYVGAFLAVGGSPSAHDLVWITLAMVGARSLAMALNRLIDARIDARNPRTAGARAPERPAVARAGRALLRGVARALPRRRLAARAEDALALADPGRRASSSTRTSSASRGSATSGSAPSTGSRRSARGSRSRTTCRGRRGCSARRSRSGSPASTSSTRSSTSRSIARRACTRSSRASACAARSSARGISHAATVACLVAAGLGLRSAFSTGSASPCVAALLAYEHSLVAPERPAPPRRGVLHDERRDQRRVRRLRDRGRRQLTSTRTRCGALLQ